MTWVSLAVWVLYGGALLALSRWASQRDALLPGRVGVAVQAFAYVATYVSAVALVGFGGLCHRLGLQMLLIAAGNVWLGIWFVYRFLAWPTRLWQRRLGARTPAELIARAYGVPGLQAFLGGISGILLVVYGSAVFKGAALMLAAAVPLPEPVLLGVLVVLVGVSVVWGGLRGVLYTEAFQGFVMVLGVGALLVAVLRAVGGPVAGLAALSALPPTEEANRGFAALSSGGAGLNVVFLALVTSVGVWAQPQLLQRHFALKDRGETGRVAPLAMLVCALVVGGTYFAGALSRLVLGPDVASPDAVVPALVARLLPEWGRQLFVLAVVSASLSTASALLHIASSCLGRDVLGRPLGKGEWRLAVGVSAGASGLLALHKGSFIAFVCATSWTLIACAVLVPYLGLLAFGPRWGRARVWGASAGGFLGATAWYLAGYGPTAGKLTGLVAPGLLGSLHPLAVGLLCSLGGVLLGGLLEKLPARESLGVD